MLTRQQECVDPCPYETAGVCLRSGDGIPSSMKFLWGTSVRGRGRVFESGRGPMTGFSLEVLAFRYASERVDSSDVSRVRVWSNSVKQVEST